MKSLGVGAIILAVLASLVATAAWLIPPMLDWNRYRGEIAALVSDNLGRAVTIEGPVSLSLLPEPILTAGRVSVDGTTADTTITVAQLRVRLALIPLLSGKVDAQELVLRGLDMRLPWPLSPEVFALHPPLWLASISARIEEGRLSVGSVIASHIEAAIGITPDTGSTAVSGTAEISGLSWHVSSRLTRSGGDGASGLDLSLDGKGAVQGLGAMFTGQIAADGAVTGRVSGSGPDLSRLIAAPSVPFKAEGRLNVAAGLAVADELAVEIAGSPARGAVALRLAPALRLDVSLAASRLDLDAWLPALLRGVAGGSRIVASIPTGIDLSAEAATLAGGTLRGLRGSFELDPDRVTLHDVAATLPGDALFALAGRVNRTSPAPAATAGPAPARADPALHFEGMGSLAAPNLRTTLAWLETAGLARLASLPPNVLRTADLRAEITADSGTPPQIQLSAMNGMIDESHVQGGLTMRPAQRLSLAGALSVDHVALDPWLGTAWPALTGLPTRIGPLDLDLQLRADQAEIAGQILAPASLDTTLESGRLTIRRLDVQSAGARLIASGALTDAGRITDGKLDLTAAPDTAGSLLATWLPRLTGVSARLPRGPLALALTAAGPPEALGVRATVDLGDLHADAQPTLDLVGKTWTSPLTLRHPGAPRLLDNIGVGNTAAWLGDGSLSWAGSLSGTGPIWSPTRVASDGFDVTAGSLRANGALVLDLGPRPRLSGRITAETLPLPLPYPRAPDPLPIGLLSGWQATVKVEAGQILIGQSPVLQKASAAVSLADGLLRLDGISAKIEGGALSGALSLNAAAVPPTLKAVLSLTGAMPANTVFDLPLDVSGGALDTSASLTASGYAPGTLLATLAGTMKLSARDGILQGVNLPRAGPHLEDADLRAALAGGSTPFERIDLTAAFGHGAVTITEAKIATVSGIAALTGLLDLTGRTAELRLIWRPPVADAPEIGLRISGPISQPARTPELAEAIKWRAEHP